MQSDRDDQSERSITPSIGRYIHYNEQVPTVSDNEHSPHRERTPLPRLWSNCEDCVDARKVPNFFVESGSQDDAVNVSTDRRWRRAFGM